MGFISFGLINNNIIPIIIGCIFAFLSRLLFNYKDAKLFEHPIISNIVPLFLYFITIIPLKILNNRVKKNNVNNEKNENNTKRKLIFKNIYQEIIKGKWKFIILASVIDFIQGVILIYSKEIKTNFWILDLIITCLFYYLIFKIRLYRHHYLSIILIILIGLSLDLVLENLQNDILNNWSLLLLRFVREILISLENVINKYIMEKKFCSVYELCIYDGLIGIILLGILSIFNYFYLKIDDFEDYFKNFNIIELLVLLAVMIIQFGLYLCVLFINKNNSPCHIFIMLVFGQFAYYIDLQANSILIFISLFLILFMSLIFNEIIEINFCGLEKNTKKNIMLRAQLEHFLIEENKLIDDKEEDDENTISIELD